MYKHSWPHENGSMIKFCASLLRRVIAFLLLVLSGPTLALVVLLLRSNTDEPILLADDLVVADGRHLRTYRFRTTGRGTPAFRLIGRFLRSYSIDEFPGLWSVVRGQMRLLDLHRLGQCR